MDQLILAEKIESLRQCFKRIEDKKPESVDLLFQNLNLQDSKEGITTCPFQRLINGMCHVGLSKEDQR